jgi:hypothetical protein
MLPAIVDCANEKPGKTAMNEWRELAQIWQKKVCRCKSIFFFLIMMSFILMQEKIYSARLIKKMLRKNLFIYTKPKGDNVSIAEEIAWALVIKPGGYYNM